MRFSDEQIRDLLRQAREDDLAQFPESHSERTTDCAQVGMYRHYARTGFPPELVEHARTCSFCQKSIAACWAVECPGWGMLSSYLKDPAFPMRKAVDRHIEWNDCGSCKAVIKLLQSPSRAKEKVEEWFSLLRQPAALAMAHAADRRREEINFLEPLEDPPVTLRIVEQGNGLLVRVRSGEVGLEGKRIEVRLQGEHTETPVRISMRATPRGEIEGQQSLELDEERLADLSKMVYISIRVTDEGDQGNSDVEE